MSSSILIRLGGLAAVAGGVLVFIADILGLFIVDFENFSETATTGSYIFWAAIYFFGLVLILNGLIALYVYQAEAAGVLGLVGFLTAFMGTAVIVGGFWDNLFLVPSLAIEAPGFLDAEQVAGPSDLGNLLAGLLTFGGLIVFGVATLRARVYPRVAAIVTMVGAALALMPLPASTVVLDVAVAWLGLIVLTGRAEAAQQPSRVS